MECRATIRTGELVGSLENGLRIFRGVPFAAPPVGARRFAPPAPVQPWQEPLRAEAFGPGPLQAPDPLSQALGLLDGSERFDEDCLQLNVWAPAEPAGTTERRPVMVWLHGGAFQSGTAAGPAYDGAHLAARGGVVVVTLNYRVGVLGFLHLGPTSVNLGLQDQLAALRWVRDEIAAFGGDPANVTVFGESAGAGSLCALLAMPAAKGLFRRAIIQSAAPEGVLSLEEAAARTRIVLDHLGIQEPDLQALRAIPAERLLEAQASCVEPGPRRIGMFFAPVVDGESLPRPPLEAIREGAGDDVDLVIGTTAEEMRLYALIPGFGEVSPEQLRASLEARLPGAEPAQVDAVLAGYPASASTREHFFALETDWHLWLPATRIAEARSTVPARTFMYRFSWPSAFQGGMCGACHALDVPFALGTLEASPALAAFCGAGPEARALSETMMDAWVGFARGGDPSPPTAPSWPPYDPARRATFELGAQPGLLEAPDEVRRAAWSEALAERSSEG